MRRWVLVGFVVAAALVSLDQLVGLARGSRPILLSAGLVAWPRPPVVVGLVHSQTGPMATAERPMIDAEVLAMEEINARGGVAGGRLLRWEVADGRSDPSTFSSQARRLIEREKAELLVGGWSAESRKAMVPVVEERGGLLIFAGNFEGMESSPNVVYAGGSANQVIPPGVRWCFDALKARRFFVVGSEEIWSRSVAEMAKDAVKASGGELAGESYLPMGALDASGPVESIRAGRPDVVLNVLVGDSNPSFYSAMGRAGLTPEKLPVLGFNVSEDDLRKFPPGEAAGHLAAWNYFQSLDRPENLEFVRKFKARYGEDRVVDDAMAAAYGGLMLWAQAASEAGSAEPRAVLEQITRQSYDAPEGIVTIDPGSRAAWRPFHLGRARADGQFDVVWSIPKPIHPEPYLATRSAVQWRDFQEGLRARWGGRWSSTEASPRPSDRATAPGPAAR